MPTPRRLLTIECATEACSIALTEGETVIAADHQILGRGHAEHLVPMIAALPDRGRAEQILVSLGPGSFTGVRIGLAVAKALGVAWGADVRGYPTLSLVAAIALRQRSDAGVTVCMAGGHGEWFMQDFHAAGVPAGPLLSLAPEEAACRPSLPLIAGSRARELAGLIVEPREVVSILPDARFVASVDPSIITGCVSPIYGRRPDARLPS